MAGRRFLTLALIVGLCVLSAAGCSRRKGRRTTINQGDSIFTTDNFPGTSVQDGNVADDKRAMSPAGDEVVDVEVFFNGDRDVAMVVYTYSDAGAFFGGGSNLYVNYYESGQFHPPVHLSRAVDLADATEQDAFFGSNEYVVGDVSVAWVNTDNDDSDLAEDRSGDALIFWRGEDFASGGGDGSDNALFYNYFDVSRSESAGFNYGFLDFSIRIDSETGGGEHVTTHGLISDGLCGEARWEGYDFFSDNGFPGRNYHWGDDTTEIILFWRELVDDGGGNFDDITFWVRFPLDQTGPSEDPLLPTSIDTIDILTFGASNSGTDSDESRVDRNYITYNFTIWQRVATDVAGTASFADFGGVGSEDITIQSSTFNTGGTDFFSPVLMHTGTPDSTDGDTDMADFIQQFGFLDGHCVYGPDEGILEIVFFSTELRDEPANAYIAINSGSLVLNQMDPATGGTSQIIVSSDDITITDSISPYTFDVVMSRNGDYLFFAWLQDVDSGATDRGLWVGHYRTSRDPDLGVLAVASATTFGVNVNPDVDGDDVNVFEFQNQLGYLCGQQSDAEVMNLFYEQSDGGYDELNVVRLTADLLSVSAAFTFTDALVTTDDDDDLISDGDSDEVGGGNYEATDSGDGGNFFVAFFRDIDTVGDTDEQLFGLRTGLVSGSGEIDSNVLYRTPDEYSLIVAGTPLSDEIAEFDSDGDNDDERASPNQLITILFNEDEVTEFLGNEAIRTRTVHTDDDSGLTFVTMFEPDLTEDPFQLSRPQANVSTPSPFVIDLLIGNGGVVVYFHQEDHTYFQSQDDGTDHDEIGWLLADDDEDDAPAATDPILVDDDDQDPSTLEYVFPTSCTCDEAHGSFIMWFKALDSGPTRLQGRVLDSDSN